MMTYIKLGIMVVVLAMFACIFDLKSIIAKRDATIATMVAESATNKANFEAAAAAKQRELDNAQRQADSNYAAAEKSHAADVARLIAAGNGLQHDIDTYVRSHSGEGLSDKGAAICRADDAAATLGDLLKRALDADAKHAADAEHLADQVRGLQADALIR